MTKGFDGTWLRSQRILCLGLLAAALQFAAFPALAAADCPGNPDALGTSRTLVVDPASIRGSVPCNIRKRCRSGITRWC